MTRALTIFSQNDGKGKFEEVGLFRGFAYDGTGTIQGTMGVEAADYDNDGHLDVHVTSYQNELSTLYQNVAGQLLEDVTNRSGVGKGTHAQVTWGNGLVDFDNDGDRDLFIASGHLYDNVERFDDKTAYRARNLLFRNEGNGRFVDITDTAGPGMAIRQSSRGTGFDDLDNDGDIDVVILNSRSKPTLLRNDTRPTGNWLDIRLIGDRSNRDAVGARVKLSAGALTLVDEVRSGRGYQSHYGSRLHFGLGHRTQIDQIKVTWPSGISASLPGPTLNRSTTIRERPTAVKGREAATMEQN